MGFSFILLLSCCVMLVETKGGIRRIKHEDTNSIQRVRVQAGKTVTLPCSVDGEDSLSPEWLKDGHRIALGAYMRYKELPKGLKIREATVDDTGTYTCRIVKGYGGSTEITVHLEVLDSPHKQISSSGEMSEESTPMPLGSKPEITARPKDRNLFKKAGDEAMLKCEVEPKLEVTWAKDGRPLPISEKNSVIRNEKGTKITLKDLKEDDSGKYTCIAGNNNIGFANATFVLKVIVPFELHPDPPEVTIISGNQTVEFGADVTFRCRVKSQVQPFIKWLKRLDGNSRSVTPNVTRNGHTYRIIKALKETNYYKGFYFNNHTLKGVVFEDEGVYLCLAAHHTAMNESLAVLSVRSKVVYRSTYSFPTLWTVLAAVMSCVIFIVLVFCLWRHCPRKQERPNSTYPPALPKRNQLLRSDTGSVSWFPGNYRPEYADSHLPRNYC